MLHTCLLIALFALEPTPQPGQIYDLLEAERAAMPISAEDTPRWADAIMEGLRANPDEEWSTRVRAYEEAGSLYWRANDFENAAPIFMGLWQEAESRNDSGEAVRSLDNLINLYGEADFPAQDVLDFYDATEAWLQNPPPGEEDKYAGMTAELWGERASRLRVFAEKADSEAAREAYLREADYFEQLRDGGQPVQRAPGKTLKDIAAAWFAKRDAAATPESPIPPPHSPTPTAPPPTRPSAEKAPVPAFAKPMPAPPAEEKPVQTPPPTTGPSSEVVIAGCVGVIAVGWAAAALWYLRKRR